MPASLSYFTGRFGPGTLDSWTRSVSVRIGARANAVRRIVGQNPLLETQFDSHGAFIAPAYWSAWNVSGPYYRRFPHDELYWSTATQVR